MLVVKIPPEGLQSIIFSHRLTAPPAVPHVSGWVKQTSVWLPRLIHCHRDRSKLTAEFIWKWCISGWYASLIYLANLMSCNMDIWFHNRSVIYMSRHREIGGIFQGGPSTFNCASTEVAGCKWWQLTNTFLQLKGWWQCMGYAINLEQTKVRK